MVQIVSGKYGHHPSELMLYSSPVYGKVLVYLYQAVPAFNWYYFFFLLAHLSSWLVLLNILYKYTHDRRLAMVLFLVLFSTFGLYFLGSLQFTTTAFLLALSGLLLIMTGKNNRDLMAGVIMVLLASMIRYYSVYLLGFLLIPWFIYKWVLCDGIFNILKHKRTMLIILGLCLMVIAIRETGKSIYNQTESGRLFRSFIFERGNLIDNPNFVYTPGNMNTFRKVNWTKEDFSIFSDYYFDQTGPFTGENLGYIYHHLEIIKPDQSRISKGFEKLVSQYQFYGLMLFLIIGATHFKHLERKELIFIVLQSVTILAFLCYLLLFNDFKARVVIPLFFIASVFIVRYVLQEKNRLYTGFIKWTPTFFIVIGIYIVFAVFINYRDSEERRANDHLIKKQFALINAVKKDWLVVHGYDLHIEHATLHLFNKGFDLNGKVYFTMPSTLMHFLTGSSTSQVQQSVFDLICNHKETILLLHNEKKTKVSEILSYSCNKAGRMPLVYTKLTFPGLTSDLYLLENQN
jgi:hypothetical protein